MLSLSGESKGHSVNDCAELGAHPQYPEHENSQLFSSGLFKRRDTEIAIRLKDGIWTEGAKAACVTSRVLELIGGQTDDEAPFKEWLSKDGSHARLLRYEGYCLLRTSGRGEEEFTVHVPGQQDTRKWKVTAGKIHKVRERGKTPCCD